MRRLANIPLQWKIGLLLAGLALLPGLFGLLGMRRALSFARRMSAERLEVTRLTAAFLDKEFEDKLQQLEWFAARAGALPDDGAEREHLIQELLRRPGPFVWFELPALTGPTESLAAQPFVAVPLTTGARYASGVHAAGPEAPA